MWAQGKDPHDNETQIRAEASVLFDFLKMADAQGLALPIVDQEAVTQILEHFKSGTATDAWPPPSVIPLAALAQHYGLPTRLLDWTRKPFVALYFAVESLVHKNAKPTKKAVVWAMQRRRGGTSLPSPLTLVAPPRADNPNLHLQSGLLCYQVQERSSSSFKQNHDEILDKSVLYKVLFPQKQAPEILRLLRNHFIHGATIYAGFDGAMRATKERAFVRLKHS